MSLLRRLFGNDSPRPAAGAVETGVPADVARNESVPSHPGAALPADHDDLDAAMRCLDDGRYRDALRRVHGALERSPDDAKWLFARARVLHAWGRTREALHAFHVAERGSPANAELHLQLAWCCATLDHLEDAESWMRKAVAGAPDSPAACYGLGVVLVRRGKLADADAAFATAIAGDPGNALYRIARGNCTLAQGDATGAEAQLRDVIAAEGGNGLAWRHLGLALFQQRRVDDAVAAYETATQLERGQEGNADTFIELAISLRDAGRIDESVALLESNLAAHPSVQGFIIYGMMLLSAGRLQDAWQYYDFRWLNEPQRSLRPKFPMPLWNGQSLQGRSLLLHVEQGLGDVIQFVRYARHLKALGAEVSLVSNRVLHALAYTVPGIDRVLGPGETAPIFDYYVPLLGLPMYYGTDEASIPAEIPYMSADPTRVQDARMQVAHAAGAALKVGIVWSGAASNDYNKRRAISLSRLAPLLDLPGVCWFSLQKEGEGIGPDEAGIAARLVALPIRNDFDGTAALIESLDLVISVDTSLAHLSGALGKPVWLLLPTTPHWVWQEHRDDSPWYPTMRIFRQTQAGQWEDVVGRVKSAVADVVAGGPQRALVGTTAPTLRQTPTPLGRLPRQMPGHRPGFAALAETRHALLAYLPDTPDSGDAIGWYGEWQEAQLRLFIDLLRPGSTVVVAAAGVGAHAIPIAAVLGAEGHVILYEAHPVLRRLLRINLESNRTQNATLMPGTLAPPGSTGEALDDLLLDRLDWIKTEVPEATPAVLAGVADTLWRTRPRLFLAIADDAALASAAGFLQGFGYRCWRHEVPLFNPANFSRREDDVFAGRTAICLLAIPEEIEMDVILAHCTEYP